MHLDTEVGRGVAGRLDQELIAGIEISALKADVKAGHIDFGQRVRRQPALLDGGAGGLVNQLVTAVVAKQQGPAPPFQRCGIGDLDRKLGVLRRLVIAIGDHPGTLTGGVVDVGEEQAAKIALQIHADFMLVIDRSRQRQCHPAEIVQRRFEALALEPAQAAQPAAVDLIVHHQSPAARGEGKFQIGRIGGVFPGAELRRVGADHQRQTVGQ